MKPAARRLPRVGPRPPEAPWHARALALLLLLLLLLMMMMMPAAAPRAAPAGVAPPEGALAAIEEAYARYAATGRSDARLHLSPDGDAAIAQSTDNGDGTTTCRVGGLRAPPGLEPAGARLRLAAVVVHETTHCLLDSHAAEPPPPGPGAEAGAALRLMRLTQESIADARSVIEIARRDGIDRARQLVDGLRPARLRTLSPSHTTALALAAALARMQPPAAGAPVPALDDGAAFAAAIDIGREAADATLREDLARAGLAWVADAPALAATRRALDAALQRALQAHVGGAYANDAVTLRTDLHGHDPADRHVWFGADGVRRYQAVIDAEGAHDAARLAELLSAGDESLAHRLAVHWLRRERQLDAARLVRVRTAIARVLPPLRHAADGDWAQRTFERTVEEMPGQDPAAVLQEAAQRLQGGPPG